MHWLMVGCSHHRTPLALREKLAFATSQVSDALTQFNQRFPEVEAVLLSTCNRVEMYAAAQRPASLPDQVSIVAFLAEYHGLQTDDLIDHLSALRDGEAIKHLFQVAASLDSMIVGEAQILSQVKQSYELACAVQTTGTLTHGAFQRAASVAKRVANETTIHRRRISVPSVAVSEIASEFFERFDDKDILVIGAGEMGTETLKYLVDAGAKHITVLNRNQARAEELARQFGARSHEWSKLGPCVGTADMIVSTTSANEPIMTLEKFREVRGNHRSSAVLILDLAVPRDFDATIATLPDVYLYTVDDLQQVCDRNVQLRQEQWPKALRIVEDEAKSFLAEMIHRGTGPTIQLLRDQADKVKAEVQEWLYGRLQARSLDDQTRGELERDISKGLDRLVNKLLHPPMQSLRDQATDGNHANLLDALRRLFQLRD